MSDMIACSIKCDECDNPIVLPAGISKLGSMVECNECGNVHLVSIDHDIEGAPFWYLVSV